MATRYNVDLLTQAPTGRHLCQFHDTADDLVEAVTLFAGAGLRRGEGVILIDEAERTAVIVRALQRAGLDPDAQQRENRLIILDAGQALQTFMRDGIPDWTRFLETVGEVVRGSNARFRRTRAFGAMVSVLWRDGNPAGAIRLEEYWNQLSRIHPLALFCGYVMNGLDESSYDGPLHEIGRTHTDVLPTDADEVLRNAIDTASEEVLGAAFSLTLSFSGREQSVGEHRLPIGRRTAAWLHRNMPEASRRILERARRFAGPIERGNGHVVRDDDAAPISSYPRLV